MLYTFFATDYSNHRHHDYYANLRKRQWISKVIVDDYAHEMVGIVFLGLYRFIIM